VPTTGCDPRDREPVRLVADPVAPPRLAVDPPDPDDTREDAGAELDPDDEPPDPPPLRDDADPVDVPDDVGVREPACDCARGGSTSREGSRDGSRIGRAGGASDPDEPEDPDEPDPGAGRGIA